MSFFLKVRWYVFVLFIVCFCFTSPALAAGTCTVTCTGPGTATATPITAQAVDTEAACTGLCPASCASVTGSTCAAVFTAASVAPAPDAPRFVCACGCVNPGGGAPVTISATQSCARALASDPTCTEACTTLCRAGTTAPDTRVRANATLASTNGAGCAVAAASSAPSGDASATGDATSGSSGGTPPTNAGRNAVPLQLSQPIDGVTVVSDFGNYIAVLYRYVIGLAGTAAVVMIVYGGFLYLLGSATSDVGKGKQIIQDAIIGLLLVLGSYTILATVNPNTLSLKVPELKTITAVALPANAPVNTSNQGCNEDANCGAGKVCLLHAKENCAGGYCGRCTDGSSGMRCRCVGSGCGADRAAYRPGPVNNNFQTNDNNTDYPCRSGLRCAAATESFQGDPEYLCIGGSFSVCNVRRDPHVECAGASTSFSPEWSYCWQREDTDVALEGICLYGDGRDRAYRSSGGATSMSEDQRGNCTGSLDASTRSSPTQKCRGEAGITCSASDRRFLDLFNSTNALYGTRPVPAALNGFNYFRKGCVKNVGSECGSDDECVTKCVTGHCTGFCFLKIGSVTSPPRILDADNIPTGVPEPNALESACTDRCGDDTWSFIKSYLDFAWENGGTDVTARTNNYVAALQSIGGLKQEDFKHTACFPKRTAGQKCDFPFQCQSGTCDGITAFDVRATPATFADPMAVTVGAGTCH